jgi:hypothetical protein
MAHANRKIRTIELPVAPLPGVREPLSTVVVETNLVAIRAFFELLAEWDSKESTNANLNQS